MSKQTDIILCGSIAIDRIMNFKGNYADLIHPKKIHVLSVSILLASLKNTPGGVAANISYTLALLKDAPVLLGSVGMDAQEYIDNLSAMGIDTTNVHFSKLPTASFNVITDMQDNQVGGFYPGAMGDSKSLSLAPWKKTKKLIVISPNDPACMKRLTLECKKWNMRLFYDISQQVSNVPAQDLIVGLKTAELLILNDYELAVFSKRTGYSIERIKKSVPVCVTTLGEKGSIIEGASVTKPIKINVAKPKTIVDPTGAGDAYRAGFLYGYIRDWPLATCGNLAAVTATFAIEKHGTQEHVFTLEQVKRRYTASFGKTDDLKYLN